jgi:hypothetical protein
MASIGIGDQKIRADTARARDTQRSSSAVTIIAAIVILLVYQGYSLSIIGVASPWIAKSFALDQAQLAELFAWLAGGELFFRVSSWHRFARQGPPWRAILRRLHSLRS